jgi:hypothetical protein
MKATLTLLYNAFLPWSRQYMNYVRRNFVLTLLCCIVTATGYTEPTKLIDFAMPDQHEKIHTQKELIGKPFLLLVTEGASQKYTQAWLDALKEAFEANPDAEMPRVMPAPQLASIPELARTPVRKIIVVRNEPWMLLDWENNFSEAYKLEKGNANILLFDGKGELLRKITAKEVDNDAVEDIVKNVADLEVGE